MTKTGLCDIAKCLAEDVMDLQSEIALHFEHEKGSDEGEINYRMCNVYSSLDDLHEELRIPEDERAYNKKSKS